MNILEWKGTFNRNNQLDIMPCSMIAMVSYYDLLIRKATRHFRKLIAAPITFEKVNLYERGSHLSV